MRRDGRPCLAWIPVPDPQVPRLTELQPAIYVSVMPLSPRIVR